MTLNDDDRNLLRNEVTARKSRGAFFTPERIANYLAEWAIGEKIDPVVLDPTCGDGELLHAAGLILKRVPGNLSTASRQLVGVDVHATSLLAARVRLATAGIEPTLHLSDFFAVTAPNIPGNHLIGSVDAVVGNPPFIRFHLHVGDLRDRANDAAAQQGVALNGRASSWAAALVHASGFLKPDGRLAMVLPAELLSVDYAEPVRRWLLLRFGHVEIITFHQRQFSDASADVILLLASGTGGTNKIGIRSVQDANDLSVLAASHQIVRAPASGKWTGLALPPNTQNAYKRARSYFDRLGDVAKVHLGTVTGANKFFALSEDQRKKWGLEESDVTAMMPSGSRGLRGATFTASDWDLLRQSGARVWLFRPDPLQMSSSAERYLQEGLRLGVNETYKSRVRPSWWAVPVSPVPDFFFSYMAHNHVRIVQNEAKVGYFNSLLGVTAKGNANLQGLHLLAMNSATLLASELMGRSYGGGVLKLEPGELSNLWVPKPATFARVRERVLPIAASLEAKLRIGEWEHVVRRMDDILLVEKLSMPPHDVSLIRSGRRLMQASRQEKSN